MTLVSRRKKFIFLRTHKTASTSVERSLEPLCLPPDHPPRANRRVQHVSDAGIVGTHGGDENSNSWRVHMAASAVRCRLDRKVWADYFKFTTVRNPYDQLVSMFFWQAAASGHEDLVDEPFDRVRAKFGQWLPTAQAHKNRLKMTIGPTYILDHVIFYEHLAEDFAEMAEVFGLPQKALPRHKSKTRRREEPFSDYYNDASRRVVERDCGFELAFFGYGLDGGPKYLTAGERARGLLRRKPYYVFNAWRSPQRQPLALN
ncbi:MAG: sulfotransferase family 2 domain-containing protein [Pseudomonadota bacterium]